MRKPAMYCLHHPEEDVSDLGFQVLFCVRIKGKTER